MDGERRVFAVVSEEAYAALELLAAECKATKREVLDALLRSHPVEDLKQGIDARLSRDAARDEAWSRSR